ncbi:ATP-binding protein [Nonomuraea sp. NN258]|uniref:tetratricopeptide repeat protein n=1 Tax=Nonomuraea antri TaxID=2730852 RepID=UPI0015685899|nr:tetratricopeptide repeat protein [Nonomuraea antri]NRQ35401.1 ATP-binding protein [Nonomuraea antri]
MKPESWRKAAIVAGVVAVLAGTAYGLSFTSWWRALANNDDGAWQMVGRIDNLSTPIGIVIAIAFGLIAAYQGRRTPAPSTATASAEPGAKPRKRADDPYKDLLNHENAAAELANRLASGAPGVVLVQGTPGVGKTELVQAVRKDLQQREPNSRIAWHDALPGEPLRIDTLIKEIEGPDAPPGSGAGASLARLNATLERYAGNRVVIVIDCAEELLNTNKNNELVDFDLDEAFEAIAGRKHHHVTVVLVTQELPRSPAKLDWPDSEPVIQVEKLPADLFNKYLDGLDRDKAFELDADVRERLYETLGGNLWLAELFHAVLAGGGFDARELTDLLSGMHRPGIRPFLIGHLYSGLSDLQRRALRALAAYDVPVDVMRVAKLFDGQDQVTVQNALSELNRRHLVRKGDDRRYYLPQSTAPDWVAAAGISADDEEWTRLLRAAARELGQMQPELTGVEDMHLYDAELRALMRLHWFDEAHEMVEDLDEKLREWNCGYRLFDHRKKLIDQLTEPRDEMTNLNALGDLYAAGGDFREAGIAYEQALSLSTRLDLDDATMRIRSNMAEMSWRRNLTEDAFRLYTETLAEAERRGDQRVRMGALEGLARCHRRRGEYASAMKRARKALSIPLLEDYPGDERAMKFASTRLVQINLRLARWHAELGERPEARKRLAEAERAVQHRWLEAACLDGWADHHLYANDFAQARTTAEKAVEKAMQSRDPTTLLQARTTLCFVHLKLDDLPAAMWQIERAERYRTPGRSLIVLALHALVARKRRDVGAAAKLFGDLHEQASIRITGARNAPGTGDEKDFAAWDLKGFALCGRRLDDDRELDTAIAAFRRARKVAEATPGLVARLKELVVLLDQCRPGRLRSVLDAFDEFGP